MAAVKVMFSDGSIVVFKGFWKQVLKDIDAHCEKYELETISAKWG